MAQTPRTLSKKIPLVELFGPTVQGEGYTIGLPTYFLRFGLCDYKCTLCDSMHAVDPIQVKANAEWLTQGEIYSKFVNFRQSDCTDWVTFSGGNPCFHDLTYLVKSLNWAGIKIAVETQGTFAPDWLANCDVITVSPKGPGMGEIFEPDKFDNFLKKFQGHRGLNVKVVVFDDQDLEFAVKVRATSISLGLHPSKFYLSQGNPYPPGHIENPGVSLVATLQQNYLNMFDKLKNNPFLSDSKFLPQFHVWLWGNRQGV